MTGPLPQYERYLVETHDQLHGSLCVYEGIVVETSVTLVRLLGKDWVSVLLELRHFYEQKQNKNKSLPSV